MDPVFFLSNRWVTVASRLDCGKVHGGEDEVAVELFLCQAILIDHGAYSLLYMGLYTYVYTRNGLP